MKNATDLLIGDQNALRFEVIRKSEAFFKTASPGNPIDVDKY